MVFLIKCFQNEKNSKIYLNPQIYFYWIHGPCDFSYASKPLKCLWFIYKEFIIEMMYSKEYMRFDKLRKWWSLVPYAMRMSVHVMWSWIGSMSHTCVIWYEMIYHCCVIWYKIFYSYYVIWNRMLYSCCVILNMMTYNCYVI